MHLQQLHLKNQRCIRGNHASGSPFAIRQIRRNDQLPLAADLHGYHAFIPAGNNPSGAEREANASPARLG